MYPSNEAQLQHLHENGDPRVFVFGSNVAGLHGGGAAWYAKNKLGAEWGVGEGLTGQTYALPTCYVPGEPVTFDELIVYVANFLEVARAHTELTFFVSAVGCGIAGFEESEVGPLFKDAPANCDLPPGWRDPLLCKRVLEFGPYEYCDAPATHLFRYDYMAPDGLNPQKIVNYRGGTCLCEAHYTDTKDDPRSITESDRTWVKL